MASFPLPKFTEQKVIETEEFQVGFKYLLLARLNIIYFNQQLFKFLEQIRLY